MAIENDLHNGSSPSVSLCKVLAKFPGIKLSRDISESNLLYFPLHSDFYLQPLADLSAQWISPARTMLSK